MKIGEVLNKCIDVVSKNPVILVPYAIPALIQLMVGLYWVARVPFWEDFLEPGAPMTPEEASRYAQSVFENIIPAASASGLLGIVSWLFTVVATAMAIAITMNYLKNKKTGLSEAFNMVSGKLIILVIAVFITTILTILGFCAIIIGAIIVAILLAFVPQGIVVDKLGFDSFSKSYNIAKSNFFDVLLVLAVFFIAGAIVGLIPWIGSALAEFVGAFSAAALTILYQDRK